MNLSKDAVAQNLRDAGCHDEFIQTFLAALTHGTPAERERLLDRERRCILGKVHDEQKKLECFDFLRYQFIRQKERR